MVNACVKSSFLYDRFITLLLIDNMILQSAFQEPVASGESVQFPQFPFHVGKGKVAADNINYIDTPHYLYEVYCNEDLCNQIYENIAAKHREIECLENRSIITTRSIFLKIINEMVGTKLPEKAKTNLSSEKVE